MEKLSLKKLSMDEMEMIEGGFCGGYGGLTGSILTIGYGFLMGGPIGAAAATTAVAVAYLMCD